jgi:hypothetical protein
MRHLWPGQCGKSRTGVELNILLEIRTKIYMCVCVCELIFSLTLPFTKLMTKAEEFKTLGF